MKISEIQQQCINHMESNNLMSYDLFDALTNDFLNNVSKRSTLFRRILIQINAKSLIDLHWTGMKRMVHTKTISDLLWYYSIGNDESKYHRVNFYFTWLLKLKNINGFGWGLNFPYTSRFIDASESMPNLYNTINSGIAICYSFNYLSETNKVIAKKSLEGILEFIDTELGFIDEGNKGWYLYYPSQKYPTYNVNALALYFFTFVKQIGVHLADSFSLKITKILNLLIEEQEIDGSWFYSRSPKGKWIDGFHSAFVIESIAFAYKNGFNSKEVEDCLDKGWKFYLEEMFTDTGFPKYFLNSTEYPMESQNIAQAIQTLSIFGIWFDKPNCEALVINNIKNVLENLYNKKGFFYYKKTFFWTYRMPYFRWSTTPMILALEYAKIYFKSLGKEL